MQIRSIKTGWITVTVTLLTLQFGGLANAQLRPGDYTAGHADLAIEYDTNTGEFDVFLEVEGATIGGAVVEEGEFDLSTVRVITDATFVRPNDGGLFANLGVAIGQPVFWLPQSNSDAAAQNVPFMGIGNEVPEGVFVDDEIELRLVSVSAPDASNDYSLWNFSGFMPVFHHATEDGISGSDVLVLPHGHDHFNLGFAPVSRPGAWVLTYEVSAQLRPPMVGTRSTQFDLHVLTCSSGTCPNDVVTPVPALPPLYLLILIAGFLAMGAVALRMLHGLRR